jgi:acyl carrier protein
VKDYRLPADRLTLEAPLADLGIDSLDTVELLWNVEDLFKIKLPSEPVELPTLGDLVRFVDELVASQHRPLSTGQGEAVALHQA